MSRPLKLWRYKKKGTEYGTYRVTLHGRPLDLETQSATEARKRWAAASKGDLSWSQKQAAKDASKVAEAFQGPAEAATEAPRQQPPPQQPPQSSSSMPHHQPPPCQSPQPPPSSQEASSSGSSAEYIPPDWSAAANSAAGTAAASEEAAKAAADAAAFAQSMGLGSVDELWTFAGTLAAKGQLWAQGQLIRRRGVEPGKVPEDFPGFQLLARSWGVQIKRWMPQGGELPLWAALLASGALCGLVQISTGTPIEKPRREEATPTEPEAAGA